jgi:hypothetical protein
VNWKKLLTCAFAAALVSGLFTVPAQAGSVGVYGAFWDTDDADSSWGGGVQLGFDFFKWMELEFHGTYYPDFGADILGSSVDITALPVDGGLKFNFLPDAKVNLYVGAGVSYYFLDMDEAEIDNQTGWYAEGGLSFGEKNFRIFAEALWRVMDTSVSFGSFDEDADFDGITGHFGVSWKWGS